MNNINRHTKMKQCFVIMPFGQPFDTYYNNIIKPSIKLNNIKVLRADEIYSNRSIIEDVIDHIVNSDIIIADVSNKNPNVNYELGIAHALRKEVIIISQSIGDIPFDYRHIRTIIYDINNTNWEETLGSSIQNTLNAILKNEFDKFKINSLDSFYAEFESDRFLGLQKVFNSRQSMNIYINAQWGKSIKQIDYMAFGLKSFRDFRTESVLEKIKSGLKIRILTIDPNSKFLKQREIDENQVPGSIKKTILDLIKWKETINLETKKKNAVSIKHYNFLPMDFYCRQDDNLFVGPYLYGIDSQQTLTYHYNIKSEIGKFYSKHFERIWNSL